jgi:hypothetical protein
VRSVLSFFMTAVWFVTVVSKYLNFVMRCSPPNKFVIIWCVVSTGKENAEKRIQRDGKMTRWLCYWERWWRRYRMLYSGLCSEIQFHSFDCSEHQWVHISTLVLLDILEILVMSCWIQVLWMISMCRLRF